MSDPVQLAIIAGVVGIAGTVVKRVFDRLDLVVKKVDSTQTAVVTLKEQTDGMKEALVRVTGEAEHAKGVIQGKAEEKEKGKENA